MIRAVLDTNVFISAVLFEGATSQLVEEWSNRRFRFLMSRDVLQEYIRVLSYPKFELTEKEIKEILAEVLFPFITPVKVRPISPVVKEDPSDDMFLALAKSGRADVLVSGDRHLLALGRFERTKIVPISLFLQQLKSG